MLLDSIKDLNWYLIYPDINMKDEINNRFVQRGNDKDFVEDRIGFYEKQITKYNELVKNPNKIILKSGQYLSDVIEHVK